MHVPGDPFPLGGRDELTLLVALELEPGGPFLQRVQQGPPVPFADPHQRGGDAEAGERHEGLDAAIVSGGKAEAREDGADLQHERCRDRRAPQALVRNGVKTREQCRIGSAGDTASPLHQCDGGQHAKDQLRVTPPPQQRYGQRDPEPRCLPFAPRCVRRQHCKQQDRNDDQQIGDLFHRGPPRPRAPGSAAERPAHRATQLHLIAQMAQSHVIKRLAFASGKPPRRA